MAFFLFLLLVIELRVLHKVGVMHFNFKYFTSFWIFINLQKLRCARIHDQTLCNFSLAYELFLFFIFRSTTIIYSYLLVTSIIINGALTYWKIKLNQPTFSLQLSQSFIINQITRWIGQFQIKYYLLNKVVHARNLIRLHKLLLFITK